MSGKLIQLIVEIDTTNRVLRGRNQLEPMRSGGRRKSRKLSFYRWWRVSAIIICLFPNVFIYKFPEGPCFGKGKQTPPRLTKYFRGWWKGAGKWLGTGDGNKMSIFNARDRFLRNKIHHFAHRLLSQDGRWCPSVTIIGRGCFFFVPPPVHSLLSYWPYKFIITINDGGFHW